LLIFNIKKQHFSHGISCHFYCRFKVVNSLTNHSLKTGKAFPFFSSPLIFSGKSFPENHEKVTPVLLCIVNKITYKIPFLSLYILHIAQFWPFFI